MRRFCFAAIVPLALLLGATFARAGDAADGRYRPANGLFSIDMRNQGDSFFKPGQEHDTPDELVVDFTYAPGATIHGMFIKRTIAWIKLDKPIPREAYDRAATDAVDGYFSARLPNGHFIVADRTKTRTDSGRLIYLFAAKGEANSEPAQWQGTVQFFDTGVALISEIMSLNVFRRDGTFHPKSGVVEPELPRWAATIEPGP